MEAAKTQLKHLGVTQFRARVKFAGTTIETVDYYLKMVNANH